MAKKMLFTAQYQRTVMAKKHGTMAVKRVQGLSVKSSRAKKVRGGMGALANLAAVSSLQAADASSQLQDLANKQSDQLKKKQRIRAQQSWFG